MKVIKELLPYIIVIIIVILIKIFIINPVKVDGDSMYATLYDGDIMLLNKTSYWFNEIERFDIVVVNHNGKDLIKRVIALPGESVEFKDNKLYINGKYIEQSFLNKNEITEDFVLTNIKENNYFLVGDNRDISLDSRILGTFDKKDIKGKAIFTIFPFTRFGIKK